MHIDAYSEDGTVRVTATSELMPFPIGVFGIIPEEDLTTEIRSESDIHDKWIV